MANTTTGAFTFDLSGGRLALDFVNTVGGMRGVKPNEHLADYGDVVEFARQAGAIPEDRARRLVAEARRRPAEAARTFGAAVELREALYRIFLAKATDAEPAAEELARLDAALRDAVVHRRLVRARTDQTLAFTWSWDDSVALDAPLWPVVASAAELLTSAAELERVRVCGLYESSECSWLFVDETRAHTRRWCSMKDCGNRAKARRHWAKAKGGAAAPAKPPEARPGKRHPRRPRDGSERAD
jgi:predicted RNA-binding Zn ribbon-like protein